MASDVVTSTAVETLAILLSHEGAGSQVSWFDLSPNGRDEYRMLASGSVPYVSSAPRKARAKPSGMKK
jgi:hypothetical protein